MPFTGHQAIYRENILFGISGIFEESGSKMLFVNFNGFFVSFLQASGTNSIL